MVRWGLPIRWWMMLMLPLLLASCGWLDRAAGNPKQEAHYMEGENLRRTAQYVAAREAYQKAIEVNPSNYFAHQELGDLYFQHFNDPLTASYHYKRYLEIGQRIHGRTFTDPTVETCIQGCQFKLAESVVGQIARQRTSVEVDQLKRENDSLRQQLTEAQRQLQIRALEARNSPSAAASTNPPTNGNRFPPSSNSPLVITPLTNRPITRPPTNSIPEVSRQRETPIASSRTYTVKSHDTPAQIARENGVRLQALMDANPGLDPRRLRPGQVLHLPPK